MLHWNPPPYVPQGITMPILKGFPPSNTISPTIHIKKNDISDRWHPPTDDESGFWPIRPQKKKHPKFTVEIIEEEKWQS